MCVCLSISASGYHSKNVENDSRRVAPINAAPHMSITASGHAHIQFYLIFLVLQMCVSKNVSLQIAQTM